MITIEEIYKHSNELKSYINKKYNFEKEDLEDFVADIMLKCYEKKNLYNKPKSKLKTWIFNVAIREIIDAHRHSKVKEKYINRYEYSNTETDTSLLDLKVFEKFLKDYPRVYNFYILRREGYDEEEIIWYMDIDKNTFKEYLKELNKLKDKFEDEK